MQRVGTGSQSSGGSTCAPGIGWARWPSRWPPRRVASRRVPLRRGPSSFQRWTHGQASTAPSTTSPLCRCRAPPVAHPRPGHVQGCGEARFLREGTGSQSSGGATSAPGFGRARWPFRWPTNVSLRVAERIVVQSYHFLTNNFQLTIASRPIASQYRQPICLGADEAIHILFR
jgi:hypothetical protein